MLLAPHTIEDNLRQWTNYPWPQDGAEWSKAWGGVDNQWKYFLLPRIRPFLPARTILEIGPGHGRWTQFLADHCDHLIVVDLCPPCIDHCKHRFAARNNVSFFTNDGRSLDMIKDASIDLVFSFDALVHANAETVGNYIRQLPAKLRPAAPGFIHHSNHGAYPTFLLTAAWLIDHTGPRLAKYLKSRTLAGFRSSDMSASLMVDFCSKAGMTCISQETFATGDLVHRSDCISIFRNSPSGASPRLMRINYRRLAEKCKSNGHHNGNGNGNNNARRPF
jgi:2-polyprenyl-3-methyl-5-hydroxy-6-metoxy-1,4-benzoquinol methylase